MMFDLPGSLFFFGDLLSFFLSNMIVIERKIYDVVFL